MKVHQASGLTVHGLVVGDFMTNCYLLVLTGAAPAEDARGDHRPVESAAGEKAPVPPVCWAVDPGGEAETVQAFLRQHDLAPERILLTHGHADHIAGVRQLKQAFPAAVLTAPAGDERMLRSPLANLSLVFLRRVTCPAPEQAVNPGQHLQMRQLTWQVLDTSGHTPGGVSYYCLAAGVVLTGDALFADGVGRTDLPGASQERLIRNIRQHLLSLPDETVVLPGHGPPTSIGQERRHNPFLLPP
jgi:glyoxylase-like metal-dependent hydrolase (beta-lactamase superfamily II)